MKTLLFIVPLLALTVAKPQLPEKGLFECDGKCDLPCSKDLDCPNGKVKDTCGCCDVCLQKETERCGGPRNLFGACAEDLKCEMIDGTDVGTCKKVMPKPTCDNVKCGFHQSCSMEGDMPVCACAMDCDKVAEDENMSFCDVDGNEYKNLCEVKKKICDTKRDFFYLPGKCEGCKDSNGVAYNHAAIVRPATEDTPCQEDWCNHGSIMTRINSGCLRDLGFTCTIGATEDTNDIQCAKGLSCHISKWSDEPENYPHLGNCKKQKQDKCYFQGKEYDLTTKFISEDCSSRCICSGWNKLECLPLCDLTHIECASDEIVQMVDYKVQEDRECRCKRPDCVKKETVCAMKSDSGPCYAYFEKWHYNTENQKCQKFVYGGCRGNANRFESKEECEKTCMPRPTLPSFTVPFLVQGGLKVADIQKQPEIKEDTPLEMPEQPLPKMPVRPFRWPQGRARKPVLSDTDMTVSGTIKFNGVKKTLQTPSCLFVTLSDVSLMDVPSTLITSQRFDVSGYDTSVDFFYHLTGKKPAENQLWRRYSVSAIIHRSRCPATRQSVNLGDFLTDTQHSVKLSKAKNDYKKDINIICYECEEDNNEEIISNEKLPVRHPGIDKDTDDIEENKSKTILLTKGCEFDGQFYKVGERFANKGCTGKCICNKDGTVSCTTLCPLKSVSCFPDEKKVVVKASAAFPGSSCLCETEVCVKADLKDDECYFAGEKHKIGESFVPKTCDGVCRCTKQHAVGCVSLCPPSGIMCRHDEIQSTKKVPVGESGCTCDEPICIPAPGKVNFPRKTEVLQDGAFPFGGTGPVYKVNLEKDKFVSINGKVTFPRHVRQFAGQSCLFIQISDVSIADASSFTVLKTKQDVSNKIVNASTMEFTVESPVPVEKDLGRVYSLSLVLFHGRCEDKRNQLKAGDFYTDSMIPVNFSKDSDNLEVEVETREYKDYILKKTEDKTNEEDEDDDDEDDDDEIIGEGGIGFIDGGAPDVQLEPNRTIQLSGKITFKKALGKLPPKSCIKFRFEDASLADASSFLVAKTTQDVSYVEIIDAYQFTFRAPKPIVEDLHDQFLVSATLFMARCPEDDSDDETFMVGDWYTDTMFNVALEEDSDVYDDIKMYLKEESVPVPLSKKPLPTPARIKNDEESLCFNLLTKEKKEEGEKWDEGDCTHCICEQGERICAMESCMFCEPEFQIKEPGRCCPICVPPPPKDCFIKETNTTVDHDSTWKKDDCTTCQCVNGELKCAVQDCVPAMCQNPVKKPGKCCPVCKKETCYDPMSKRTYKNNEFWVQADGCTRCYCFAGNTPMCASPMCYLEPCDKGVEHVNVKGVCCPVCANKQVCRTEDKGVFVEGRVWQNNQCQVCRCTAKGVECVTPDTDTKNCVNGRVVQLTKDCGRICLKDEKKEIKDDDDKMKEKEQEEKDDDDENDDELFP